MLLSPDYVCLKGFKMEQRHKTLSTEIPICVNEWFFLFVLNTLHGDIMDSLGTTSSTPLPFTSLQRPCWNARLWIDEYRLHGYGRKERYHVIWHDIKFSIFLLLTTLYYNYTLAAKHSLRNKLVASTPAMPDEGYTCWYPETCSKLDHHQAI